MLKTTEIKLPMPAALARKYPYLRGVTFSFVEVTPELAKNWLAMNTRNRSSRPNQVKYLSQSFLSEGGRFTTDCIAFRTDDTILNGQHRLEACVQTQVSFPALVLRGVPDDVDEVEDHVAPRLARDLVRTKAPGIKNSKDKTTIPKLYWRFKEMRADASWTAARWDKQIYTKNCIAEYVIDNDKKLSWALKLVHNNNADLVFFPRSTFAAAALVLADQHKGATQVFFQRLATGEGLESGDPLLWLRNYLLKQFREKAVKGTESVDPVQVRIAFIFMAWNAWLEGKQLKKAPRIYIKDKTGMQTTVSWPVPKRPGGEYKPWI